MAPAVEHSMVHGPQRRASALVVEGLPLYRQALIRLLSEVLEVKVVVGGSAPLEMWVQLRDTKPDLLVLDGDLLGEDVVAFLPYVPVLAPVCRVVFMITRLTARDLQLAARHPIAAYLPKTAGVDYVEQVFRTVLRGETVAPPLPRGQPRHSPRSCDAGSGGRPAAFPLSKRELNVLRRVARGLAIQEIARELALSPDTVNRTRYRVTAKLGIYDRVDLARFAIRQGLIAP
jgi:DNA-binding NarL/FixJ family response regulator